MDVLGAARTLLQGQGLQSGPSWDLLQPWWSFWGCWGGGGCSTPSPFQGTAYCSSTVMTLWEGYGGILGFTKPKGEKFSLASEELESGTAKSCLRLFSPLSQLLFLFLLSLGQFSLLEGAHSCLGSYFLPPNVNLHPGAKLWGESLIS